MNSVFEARFVDFVCETLSFPRFSDPKRSANGLLLSIVLGCDDEDEKRSFCVFFSIDAFESMNKSKMSSEFLDFEESFAVGDSIDSFARFFALDLFGDGVD